MALTDLQHVEAVAIIRNLLLALGPPEGLDGYATICANAGHQWLEENHPSPATYIAAITAANAAHVDPPEGSRR